MNKLWENDILQIDFLKTEKYLTFKDITKCFQWHIYYLMALGILNSIGTKARNLSEAYIKVKFQCLLKTYISNLAKSEKFCHIIKILWQE